MNQMPRNATKAMAKRNVVYVVQTPLARRDFLRHGMARLIEQGASVHVLDISQVIFTHIPFESEFNNDIVGLAVTVCDSVKYFENALATIEGIDLLVFLAASGTVTRKNRPFLRHVSRQTFPYLVITGPVFPGWRMNSSRHRVGENFENLLPVLAKKDYLDSLITRLPLWLLSVRPADFILSSDVQNIRRNKLKGPRTFEIKAHHPDFDQCLQDKASGYHERDIAVFIDQNMPFHHDFKQSRTRPPDPDVYYGALKSFFDHVEATLGLKVVIAAHPRANIEQIKDHAGIEYIEIGKTNQLIAESRLVLAHSSSAISMAIMNYKPIVILSTAELWRVGVERCFEQEISATLGVPLVFADASPDADTARYLKIDRVRYDAYLHSHLIRPDTPAKPLWDIAFSYIFSGNGPAENPANVNQSTELTK